MLPKFETVRGTQPGLLLRKALKDRGEKIKVLADLLGKHQQTISAILQGERKITPQASILLGKYFNVDADYFIMLYSSYLVTKITGEKKK